MGALTPASLDGKLDDASLQQAFAFWDKSNDGNITIVEFSKMLVKAEGETPPFSDICKFFKKADADKSGGMDREEFCKLARALKAGEVEGLGQCDVVELSLVEQAFDLWDKGEDGNISIMEFSKMLVKAEGEAPPFSDIYKFFKKADTDESGGMDRQEFRKLAKALKAGEFEGLGSIDVTKMKDEPIAAS